MTTVYYIARVTEFSSTTISALKSLNLYNPEYWGVILSTLMPLRVGEDFIHSKYGHGLPYSYKIIGILCENESCKQTAANTTVMLIVLPLKFTDETKPKHKLEITPPTKSTGLQ